LASICSGFVAPVMTEATGASESSQPIASSSAYAPLLGEARERVDPVELLVAPPRREDRRVPGEEARLAGTCL
jgi:hypothetical protein